MRKLACCLGLPLLLLPFVGCAALMPDPNSVKPKVPVVAGPPTAEQLLAYQRSNAELIQSMQSRSVDLECKQGSMGASLEATLHTRKPRDFRLIAKSVISDEVDLGSNNNEFWYWVKRGDPKTVFRCGYEDFDNGTARMPFPFQPEYVLEALGMAVTGTPEKCRVVAHAETCDLIEDAVIQGKPVRKVTVFRRQPVPVDQMRKGTPQVTEHQLQDATGHVIVAARIESVQLVDVGKVSAVVPKLVRLVCPDEKVILTMKIDRPTLNQPMTPEQSNNLFTRSKLSHLQTFDLARGMQGANGDIRRVGGP